MEDGLYPVFNMNQEVLYSLSIGETWLLKKMYGYYDDGVRPSFNDIANSQEYLKYFKDKSIYSSMRKVTNKYRDFIRLTKSFQKKLPGFKALSFNEQVFKISVNDFEDRYYIGNFQRDFRDAEKFQNQVSSYETTFHMKKVVVSPTKVVKFYFQELSLVNRCYFLLENVFDDTQLCNFFSKFGLRTMNDLAYFNVEKHFLIFYQYLNENKNREVSLLHLFPIVMVEPYLRQGIFTVQDFYDTSEDVLISINEVYYEQIDHLLKKLHTPSLRF